METSIARTETDYTIDQIDLIKQTVAKGATDLELKLFLYQASRTGLDPLAKQIHCVKRWNSESQSYQMAIQTGIDGYRLTASRSGDLAGIDDAIFGPDEGGHPTSATVTVHRLDRTGQPRAYTATARWVEYVQKKKDGSPTSFWMRAGYGQLAKCAEALALRKAFPADLSGVYTNEEMQQAGEPLDPSIQTEATVTAEKYGIPAEKIGTKEASDEVARQKIEELSKPPLAEQTQALLQGTATWMKAENTISPKQVKALWAAAREQKMSEDGVRGVLRRFEVEHTKDLPQSKFQSVMDIINNVPPVTESSVQPAGEEAWAVSGISNGKDYFSVSLLSADGNRAMSAWIEPDPDMAQKLTDAKKDHQIILPVFETTPSAGAHKNRPIHKIVEFSIAPF